jgi:hypothetical protein
MFAAAWQGPDFFAIYGSVGQYAENRRNGDSEGKLFPRRDLPSAIDDRPHQLVRPLGIRTGSPPPRRTVMRRITFDILMATAGLFLAVTLIAAGGLLTWAHTYIGNA